MQRSFSVIGGDRRQAELLRLLVAEGQTVCSYGLRKWEARWETSLEEAALADVVVFPLPFCREEGILNCEGILVSTLDLFRRLTPSQIVLAGQVKEAQRREAKACGLRIIDYFKREELAVANAAATAEGAIQIALQSLDRTLLGQECLVLGFGRIGKLLSYRLHGLGARVTATARKAEDLAWIRAYGWDALNTDAMDSALKKFTVVFNTIPSLVLNRAQLEQLPTDCLCVDLASIQGVDEAEAVRLGKTYIWARSLPGKLVPHTAAEAIRDAVYYIINDES